MSTSKDAIHGSLVVLEAVDAARNTRAFTLFLGCAISALIVAGLLAGIGVVELIDLQPKTGQSGMIGG